jgi:hypothetical protein
MSSRVLSRRPSFSAPLPRLWPTSWRPTQAQPRACANGMISGRNQKHGRAGVSYGYFGSPARQDDFPIRQEAITTRPSSRMYQRDMRRLYRDTSYQVGPVGPGLPGAPFPPLREGGGQDQIPGLRQGMRQAAEVLCPSDFPHRADPSLQSILLVHQAGYPVRSNQQRCAHTSTVWHQSGNTTVFTNTKIALAAALLGTRLRSSGKTSAKARQIVMRRATPGPNQKDTPAGALPSRQDRQARHDRSPFEDLVRLQITATSEGYFPPDVVRRLTFRHIFLAMRHRQSIWARRSPPSWKTVLDRAEGPQPSGTLRRMYTARRISA